VLLLAPLVIGDSLPLLLLLAVEAGKCRMTHASAGAEQMRSGTICITTAATHVIPCSRCVLKIVKSHVVDVSGVSASCKGHPASCRQLALQHKSPCTHLHSLDRRSICTAKYLSTGKDCRLNTACFQLHFSGELEDPCNVICQKEVHSWLVCFQPTAWLAFEPHNQFVEAKGVESTKLRASMCASTLGLTDFCQFLLKNGSNKLTAV
jgi:hypothetical protein